MIEPVKYNLNLYRSADFNFSFRIKIDGTAQDATEWGIKFTACDKPEGTIVKQYEYGDSPAHITVDADDDFLITLAIPASQTDIDNPSLYYEFDLTNPDGEVQRWLVGTINVIRNAEA